MENERRRKFVREEFRVLGKIGYEYRFLSWILNSMQVSSGLH